MTCGLHSKFDTAVEAVKEAFKEAVDTKDFDRSTLSEVWRHYQGLQTITEGLPDHEEHTERPFLGEDSISFDGVTLPDGCYDPDYNINLYNNDPLAGDLNLDTNLAAETVPVPAAVGSSGKDVISFG